MGSEIWLVSAVVGTLVGKTIASTLMLPTKVSWLVTATVAVGACGLWLHSPLPNRVGMVVGGTGAGYWGLDRPEDLHDD